MADGEVAHVRNNTSARAHKNRIFNQGGLCPRCCVLRVVGGLLAGAISLAGERGVACCVVGCGWVWLCGAGGMVRHDARSLPGCYGVQAAAGVTGRIHRGRRVGRWLVMLLLSRAVGCYV